MQVSDQTRFIAVLGDPISHSLSPALHQAVIEDLHLDLLYLPIRATEADLPGLFSVLQSGLFLGCNVTLPHKEAVALKLSQPIDETVEKVGVVNTVVFKDGQSHGHNTDIRAFTEDWVEQSPVSPQGQTAWVFGAGGAARAVIFALCQLGVAQIIVCNRTVSKAQGLIKWAGALFADVKLSCCSYEKNTVNQKIGFADFVIHASSLGVHSAATALPFDLKKLKPGVFLYDLNYKNALSPLYQMIQAKPLPPKGRFSNGLGMFVRQAAASFSLWTGHEVSWGLMKQKIEAL